MAALAGLGLYQLYQYGFAYDKFAHLVIPFILTIGLADFFMVWYKSSFYKSLAVRSLIVMIGGLGWEAYEFITDWFFRTRTLGQYGREITRDTVIDIIMNTVGIFFAISFAFVKEKTQQQPA